MSYEIRMINNLPIPDNSNSLTSLIVTVFLEEMMKMTIVPLTIHEKRYVLVVESMDRHL